MSLPSHSVPEVEIQDDAPRANAITVVRQRAAVIYQRLQNLRQRDERKSLCVLLLRQLQTKPKAALRALFSRWAWPSVLLVWFVSLLTPPRILCQVPPTTLYPGMDNFILFRVSSFSTWHAESGFDPEYLIHRALSSLPCASDPATLLGGSGTLMFCKSSAGKSTLVATRDDHVHETESFLRTLDVNRNGLLDRAELWRLEESLRLWLPDGDTLAEKIVTSNRDADGGMNQSAALAFWLQNIRPEYHRFAIVNTSRIAPANADEDAFRMEGDYINYVPLGRIEAVSTSLSFPILGYMLCRLGEDPWYLFWDLFYTIVVSQGVCLLCYRVLQKLNYDIQGSLVKCMVLVTLSLILSALNPILFACFYLYISTEIGKILTVLLLLSSAEYQRLLSQLEYRLDQREWNLDVDDQQFSLAALDVQLVRCPICRRLSSSRHVVRKVHGDMRRDQCCVCLASESEVCFVCGHLCMCSGCFDSLLDHRHHALDDPGLATTWGNTQRPEE